MSPFDFGKNFLEEQSAVIESLENRILDQELTLEEFIESFDILVRNIQSKEHLQIVLEKITQLNMTPEAKNHVQEILIQLHESKVTQQVSSSLGQESIIDFTEIPESQVAPAENTIDNEDSMETKQETPKEDFSIKPSIQVYDEWTETDSIYDAGEWYEGISFTTNIEAADTNAVNTLVQLEEDIQDTVSNTYENPTDLSYEGIQVVVAAKEVAESLHINKYEISEELSQDSFPYEYVDSIISRAKGLSVTKDIKDIPSFLSEELEDYDESDIHAETEISSIENTNILEQPKSIEDIDIQNSLEKVDELIDQTFSTENGIQDSQAVDEIIKTDNIEEPLVEIGLNDNVEMTQEENLLDVELENNSISNELAIIQDIRDNAENTSDPEIQEQTEELNLETSNDTAELTDIRDILEFVNTQTNNESTNTTFDTISSFKTPAILNQKAQQGLQEYKARVMEDTQKEVQEELLRETYKEELEVQKPLESSAINKIPQQLEKLGIISSKEELKANTNDIFVVKEIPKNVEKPAQTDINTTVSDLQNDTKPDYWWVNYPVLEYPEVEDFGLFILYRDLG